jgi:hypothetical protein
VLAGEELALIVDEIGADLRDTRGLLRLMPVKMLADPALQAFAEKAEVTDLSEVTPLMNKEGKPDPSIGYQLAELDERVVPPAPEFESSEVQGKLREFFTKQRNQRILGRERENLRRDAYLWINPLLGGGQAPNRATPATQGPQAQPAAPQAQPAVPVQPGAEPQR